MAYIGKIPAAAALTATDITDGIISNAKLAQDIISAETALTSAPADTDEFLVSDAGTLKRIDASLVGSSDFVKISTTTASSSSTINYDNSLITSSYQTIMITFNGMSVANDAEDIYIQLSVDNGSGFLTGISARAYGQIDSGSTHDFHVGSNASGGVEAAYHLIGQDIESTAGTGGTSGIAWIHDIQGTAEYKWITSLSASQNQNGSSYYYYNTSRWASTSAINYIRILNGSGNNIDGGVVNVYGYK